MTPADYLKILFDPGDFVCFGSEDVRASIRVAPANVIPPDALYVCINALHEALDLAPDPRKANWSLPYRHRADLGRRADVNVIKHRAWLIECDKGALDEQAEWLRATGVPYSTLTESGGKSLHAVVVSDEAVSAAEYAEIATKLMAIFPSADPMCRNPSRFTRLPGAIRPSTGRPQRLLELRGRVSLGLLREWLEENTPAAPEAKAFAATPSGYRKLYPMSEDVRQLLERGPGPDGTGRHDRLRRAACYLAGLPSSTAAADAFEILMDICARYAPDKKESYVRQLVESAVAFIQRKRQK